MSTWQPIETAPRDGTVIIIAIPPNEEDDNPYWGVELAKWGVIKMVGCIEEPGWVVHFDNDTGLIVAWDEDASHWMPFVTPAP